MGSAASLTVEENLVLALKRGAKRTLKWSLNESRRALFREKLELLKLGLEDRLTTPVKLLSGGQRQAIDPADDHPGAARLILLDERRPP